MAVNILDKLGKIPTKARAGIFFGLIAVAGVLFLYYVHIPKTTEIANLGADIAALQETIRQNDAKIKKLDELKAEVAALEARLKVLTAQLPPESEVSSLLRQVQGLVNQSGLSLKLWKPDRKRMHSSGMYEEIPINLQLTGGYHNVGVFFDKVSKLTRIVNILNVSMQNAKVVRGGAMEIAITCTAMTFAAVEKKVEQPKTPTKKGQ